MVFGVGVLRVKNRGETTRGETTRGGSLEAKENKTVPRQYSSPTQLLETVTRQI